MADPDDSPGLATMTAEMLREGTERRTSAEIADEVDSVGAALNASTPGPAGHTSVNASGRSIDADHILDLMSDIVLHPTFPATELTQYKQREETALEQSRAGPNFLAREQLRKALFIESPISNVSPTKQSVEKVTADDMRTFHDQHFRPGNTLFGVCGDFKADEMSSLIEKYFGA